MCVSPSFPLKCYKQDNLFSSSNLLQSWSLCWFHSLRFHLLPASSAPSKTWEEILVRQICLKAPYTFTKYLMTCPLCCLSASNKYNILPPPLPPPPPRPPPLGTAPTVSTWWKKARMQLKQQIPSVMLSSSCRCELSNWDCKGGVSYAQRKMKHQFQFPYLLHQTLQQHL